MGRTWTEAENKMIKDNYPANGGVFVVNLLQEAGIFDRDAFAVIRQASKLKIKRKRKEILIKS